MIEIKMSRWGKVKRDERGWSEQEGGRPTVEIRSN